MKHKQNEISKLWDEIKQADKLDTSVINKIEQILLDDKPKTRSSERLAKNKQKANRKLAAIK